MRYQEIIKTKQRAIRLLWTLSILILGLVLSGWLSPAGAQVLLCGDSDHPLSPDPDGIYRLRGHLTCSGNTILEIKGDSAANTEFDLRGFIATGGSDNYGIRIRNEADNVTIVGGTFKKCETALRVQANGCEIEHFKAINSSGRAIRIDGDGNSIVKSLCLIAGGECFELEGRGTTAESCTAIKSGEQGFNIKGPGDVYKCYGYGNGGEGIQISTSDVTIYRCIFVNNTKHGIEIEEGIRNFIKHNIVFSNGDGESTRDLTDRNDNCGGNEEANIWKRNKFRTSNIDCIE